MADTFSPNLGLRLQQTGGNDNTWGELLNTDVFEVIENAITGIKAVSSTGGATDLSASPIVEPTMSVQGTLTSDATIILPNLPKRLTIYNGTSGSFYLLVKCPGGTTVGIPPLTNKTVLIPGNGTVLREDRYDVGAIVAFPDTYGGIIPGYLACNGSAVSRTGLPDLFAFIGTMYGVGNGSTTFNLPDLTTAGRFLRSFTDSVPVGTLQGDRFASHNHTASGSFSGTQFSVTPAGSVSVSTPTGSVSTSISGQDSGVITSKPGVGPFSTPTGGLNWSAGGTISASSTFTGGAASGSFSGTQFSVTPAGSVSVTVNSNGDTETRPVNMSVFYGIRI